MQCHAAEKKTNDNTFIRIVGEIDETTCTIALNTLDQTVMFDAVEPEDDNDKMSARMGLVINEEGCARVRNIKNNKKYPFFLVTIYGPSDGNDFLLGSKKIHFVDDDGYGVIPNREEQYSYRKEIEEQIKYSIEIKGSRSWGKKIDKGNVVIMEMKYI